MAPRQKEILLKRSAALLRGKTNALATFAQATKRKGRAARGRPQSFVLRQADIWSIDSYAEIFCDPCRRRQDYQSRAG